MKAYAETLEYVTRGVEERVRERERESLGVKDLGERYIYPRYIDKFSIYRENKR